MSKPRSEDVGEPRSEDVVADLLERRIGRRTLLRGAISGAATLGVSGLVAACGGSSGSTSTGTTAGGAPAANLRRGGTLRVGVAGASTDTLNAHNLVSEADNMRVWQLYEPLLRRSDDFSKLELILAESVEAEGSTPDSWIVRLKPDIEFHDGKTVGADDVIFTLQRILNPKDPQLGAASLSYVDVNGIRKVDARTVRIPLKTPNAIFPDDLGQYWNGIVPVGYDPKRPIGTGPFKYQSFTPGERSVFAKFANYRIAGEPLVDELAIINFDDDTARVNALLGGQVEAIDGLPQAQTAAIKSQSGFTALISKTGNWRPLVMNTKAAPFTDGRVCQAFKLIVDRQQVIDQALAGQGTLGNDVFGRYDPAYDTSLPQRQQDIEQARSLLRQAGHASLRVELVAAPIQAGMVQTAEVFAQQASAAGVTVSVRRVDGGTFYGDNYLSWPFSVDWWGTRMFVPQVAASNLPDSAYFETHWSPPAFQQLIATIRRTLDESTRNNLIREAMRMVYEQSGYIIPFFANNVDAYSDKVGGFSPAVGYPLGNFAFRRVGFVS